MFGHPPFGDQPLDIVAIDLAPHALAAARHIALHERFFVPALADGIDPAPAQGGVDRLDRRYRRLARGLLEDADPNFWFRSVMVVQPGVKTVLAGKFMHSGWVDNHRRHLGF
jgi:hypothetical protein